MSRDAVSLFQAAATVQNLLTNTGATISATEDGRRLYVFGGNDGGKALNDVHFLELEKLTWSMLTVHVRTQNMLPMCLK